MHTEPAASEVFARAQDAASRCDWHTVERLANQAASLAERQGDEVVRYRARRAAAWSWYERGEFGRAAHGCRLAFDGLQAAGGMDDFYGPACVDLFGTLGFAGNLPAAEVYRSRAERSFGSEHPRVFALAADAAVLQLVVGNDPDASKRLLSPLDTAGVPADAQLTVYANLTASLALSGERLAARRRVALLRQMLAADAACPAWSWYALALSHAAMGDLADARRAATRARKTAALHREEFTRKKAAELLARLS